MEKNLQKERKGKTRKRPFRFFVYDFVKWTGAWPIVVWFRIKCIYENKDAKKKIKGGALICANHISYKDPIILSTVMWYRRLHFVALKEMFSTKLATWFFTHILCLPIDRQNVSINSFKDIIEVLKDRRVVGIFPEGHINHEEGKLDFFKSGIVLMAMRAKVPIVPMVIIKKDRWWQRQKVVVGQPINLPEGNLNLDQISEFSEILRQKEGELIELYNQRRKKK